jgi:hypothetical protein
MQRKDQVNNAKGSVIIISIIEIFGHFWLERECNLNAVYSYFRFKNSG